MTRQFLKAKVEGRFRVKPAFHGYPQKIKVAVGIII